MGRRTTASTSPPLEDQGLIFCTACDVASCRCLHEGFPTRRADSCCHAWCMVLLRGAFGLPWAVVASHAVQRPRPRLCDMCDVLEAVRAQSGPFPPLSEGHAIAGCASAASCVNNCTAEHSAPLVTFESVSRSRLPQQHRQPGPGKYPMMYYHGSYYIPLVYSSHAVALHCCNHIGASLGESPMYSASGDGDDGDGPSLLRRCSNGIQAAARTQRPILVRTYPPFCASAAGGAPWTELGSFCRVEKAFKLKMIPKYRRRNGKARVVGHEQGKFCSKTYCFHGWSGP